MRRRKLTNEIVEAVSMIPLECQEHILDVVKAMAFTRQVMDKTKKGEKKS